MCVCVCVCVCVYVCVSSLVFVKTSRTQGLTPVDYPTPFSHTQRITRFLSPRSLRTFYYREKRGLRTDKGNIKVRTCTGGTIVPFPKRNPSGPGPVHSECLFRRRPLNLSRTLLWYDVKEGPNHPPEGHSLSWGPGTIPTSTLTPTVVPRVPRSQRRNTIKST